MCVCVCVWSQQITLFRGAQWVISARNVTSIEAHLTLLELPPVDLILFPLHEHIDQATYKMNCHCLSHLSGEGKPGSARTTYRPKWQAVRK